MLSLCLFLLPTIVGRIADSYQQNCRQLSASLPIIIDIYFSGIVDWHCFACFFEIIGLFFLCADRHV
jgi:hypothetical protein